MIDLIQLRLRPFWKWTLLSPLLGIASYVVAAVFVTVTYDRHAALLLRFAVLIFAPASALASIAIEYKPMHDISLGEHTWLAVVNAGVYLAFGILYALKAEGYKLFSIVFWLIIGSWVLFAMKLFS